MWFTFPAIRKGEFTQNKRKKYVVFLFVFFSFGFFWLLRFELVQYFWSLIHPRLNPRRACWGAIPAGNRGYPCKAHFMIKKKNPNWNLKASFTQKAVMTAALAQNVSYTDGWSVPMLHHCLHLVQPLHVLYATTPWHPDCMSVCWILTVACVNCSLNICLIMEVMMSCDYDFCSFER